MVKKHPNSVLLFQYLYGGLNNRPFDDQTHVPDLSTGLAYYSDPHLIPLYEKSLDKRLKHRGKLT